MLSGATDEGSLIGTINRAEVYRYYTKPCDSTDLRGSLRDAVRHYWRMQDATDGGQATGHEVFYLEAQSR